MQIRRMRKRAAGLLLAALLLSPGLSGRTHAAVDDAFRFNGIQYHVTEESLLGGTVEVIADTNKYSGNIVIPATVLYAAKQYDVTAVGAGAFGENTALTGVSLPDSMTQIGDAAFYGCTRLAAVAVPAGVETIGDSAFYGCTRLAQITLRTGLRTIADSAFVGCTALRQIEIPASVESIGPFALRNCRNLTAIAVDAANPFYRSEGGMLYDASMQTLLQCPGGKTGVVAVPLSVGTIGDGAFDGCWGLTGVTLPPGITEIGEEAFSNCIRLAAIDLPSGLATVAAGAFAGCTQLASVTVPAGVTRIGTDAFYNCTALDKIGVDAANARYAEKDGILHDKAVETLLCCPAGKSGSVAVETSVRTLGPNAFSGCTRVTAVSLPAGIRRIPGFAFDSCTGLRSVTVFAPSFFFWVATFQNAAQDFVLYTAGDPADYTGAIPQGVKKTRILSVPARVGAQNGVALLDVTNRCPFTLTGLRAVDPAFSAQAAGQALAAGATTRVQISFSPGQSLPQTVAFATDEGVAFSTELVLSATAQGGATDIPNTGDRTSLLAEIAAFLLPLAALCVLRARRGKRE